MFSQHENVQLRIGSLKIYLFPVDKNEKYTAKCTLKRFGCFFLKMCGKMSFCFRNTTLIHRILSVSQNKGTVFTIADNSEEIVSYFRKVLLNLQLFLSFYNVSDFFFPFTFIK